MDLMFTIRLLTLTVQNVIIYTSRLNKKNKKRGKGMKLLNEKEFQKEFGISRALSIKMRKEGLPHIVMGEKLLRYDYDEVSEYIKKNFKKINDK